MVQQVRVIADEPPMTLRNGNEPYNPVCFCVHNAVVKREGPGIQSDIRKAEGLQLGLAVERQSKRFPHQGMGPVCANQQLAGMVFGACFRL